MWSLLNTILTYSWCILDCPWSFLAGKDGAKSTDKGFYIMAAGIRNTCARDACIGSTSATGAWIRCASIESACIKDICAKNTFVGGVEP